MEGKAGGCGPRTIAQLGTPAGEQGDDVFVPTTSATFEAWAAVFYRDLDEAVAAGRVPRTIRKNTEGGAAVISILQEYVREHESSPTRERSIPTIESACSDPALVQSYVKTHLSATALNPSSPPPASNLPQKLTGKAWFLRQSSKIDWSLFQPTDDKDDNIEYDLDDASQSEP